MRRGRVLGEPSMTVSFLLRLLFRRSWWWCDFSAMRATFFFQPSVVICYVISN